MLDQTLTQADYNALYEALDFYLDHLAKLETTAFKITTDTNTLGNFIRKTESIRRVQNRLYEASLLN